jgi:hypothetical protein
MNTLMSTRKPFHLVLSLAVLIGCASHSRQPETVSMPAAPAATTGYTWTKLLDSAAWKKNYNYQLFSIRDTLWTLHPDGCWFSVNGKDWTKSPLANAIHNQAFLDYAYFKGALYGLGHFEGNIETFQFRPEIYRSTDMRNWQTISLKSDLPVRFFYHPFVFNDKIWIIGGEDKDTKYADAWNSVDGITWTRVKDNLPFGKRSGSQVLTLNDTLYLLDNDVWRSADGLNWEQICPEIVAGEQIFGYAALVFDARIWLLGCNRNGQFTSQVLSSSDGKNWEGSDAPWLPRGGIAAVTHQGKVYMTGGKYGGTPNHPNFRYDNDVWVMSKE